MVNTWLNKVQAGGMLSEFSEPQHIMTHCLTDEDCAWGDAWTRGRGRGRRRSSEGGGNSNNVTCNQHTALCEGFDPLLLQRSLSRATSAWSHSMLQTHFSAFLLALLIILIGTMIFFPSFLPCYRGNYYESLHNMNDGPFVIDHHGKKIFTSFGPDLGRKYIYICLDIAYFCQFCLTII